MQLTEKKCKPCSGETPTLSKEKAYELLSQLEKGWEVLENKKIKKKFEFKNFKEGMAFTQEVANIAQEEGHHPDICIHYRSVEVELTTHAIEGLSENDFIMAAKIDAKFFPAE